MNKKDIINKLSDELNIGKNDASRYLSVLTDIMEEVLSKGETIQLIGFGSFSVKETEERKGRNPSTQKEITIPAGKRIKFTPGKKLKEAVSGKTDNGNSNGGSKSKVRDQENKKKEKAEGNKINDKNKNKQPIKKTNDKSKDKKLQVEKK